MMIRNKEIIWLLPFFIILSKWILIFYIYRDFSYDFSILLNFNDVSYFPFIVSLSELNLSPTFNEYFVTEKLITFPIILFSPLIIQRPSTTAFDAHSCILL